jgi:hypothetical protein
MNNKYSQLSYLELNTIRKALKNYSIFLKGLSIKNKDEAERILFEVDEAQTEYERIDSINNVIIQLEKEKEAIQSDWDKKKLKYQEIEIKIYQLKKQLKNK